MFFDVSPERGKMAQEMVGKAYFFMRYERPNPSLDLQNSYCGYRPTETLVKSLLARVFTGSFWFSPVLLLGTCAAKVSFFGGE